MVYQTCQISEVVSSIKNLIKTDKVGIELYYSFIKLILLVQ